jgi:hypothetical protein
MFKDSNYIRKYLKRGAPYIPKKDRKSAGNPIKNYNAFVNDVKQVDTTLAIVAVPITICMNRRRRAKKEKA